MKIEILAVGRHDEIMQTLLRLINKNEQWNGTGATTDEEAMEVFTQQKFDIVLFSSGLSEESENLLTSHFRQHDPTVIIIQHYGGGSGLLTNELLEALHERNSRQGNG